MKLSLDNIRLDGGTQPRAEMRIETVSDYAEAMKNGAEFPPVVVFYDGTDYWLADGFHRLRAWGQTFRGELIEADVRQGTQADAQWFSYGANKEHDTAGTRRNSSDIGRAILAALQHPKGVSSSNTELAEHIGCNHATVSRHRKRFESSFAVQKMPERDVTRNGKTYKQDTSNIGKRRKQEGRAIGKDNSLKPLTPIRGLSKPCPMIPVQFSPNNAKTAAATLWQLFPRNFCEQLVQELSQRLTLGESA